jgi:hypothetical protein
VDVVVAVEVAEGWIGLVEWVMGNRGFKRLL